MAIAIPLPHVPNRWLRPVVVAGLAVIVALIAVVVVRAATDGDSTDAVEQVSAATAVTAPVDPEPAVVGGSEITAPGAVTHPLAVDYDPYAAIPDPASTTSGLTGVADAYGRVSGVNGGSSAEAVALPRSNYASDADWIVANGWAPSTSRPVDLQAQLQAEIDAVQGNAVTTTSPEPTARSVSIHNDPQAFVALNTPGVETGAAADSRVLAGDYPVWDPQTLTPDTNPGAESQSALLDGTAFAAAIEEAVRDSTRPIDLQALLQAEIDAVQGN